MTEAHTDRPPWRLARHHVENDLKQMREGGIFLFVSVDMVNSTEFKNREVRWPLVMHHFYNDVIREIGEVCPHFNVWKYMGDEVVFWRHMQPGDDIAGLVSGTYEAVGRICSNLDGVEARHRIKTRNLISAKATIWAAAAEFVPESNIDHDLHRAFKYLNRIILDKHIISGQADGKSQEISVIDFVGPEIDIGFRISKFAQPGFILLGAGATYLLLKQDDERHNVRNGLKIVSYERLKGVWNGRVYPIIWYAADWSDVDQRFAYDEKMENPVVAKVCRREYDDVGRLETILDQTNRLRPFEEAARLLVSE